MDMTLNMCVVSTFDLDLNTLDSMIPEDEDVSRYTVFYGEGLFRDLDGHCPREAGLRNSLVRCCMDDGFVHGKMILRESTDGHGNFIYNLEITSRNIYSFDNREISVTFSGTASGEKQRKSAPISRYLTYLAAFMDDSNPRRNSVLELAARFSYVKLELTGPYRCRDWKIYASCPSSDDLNPVLSLAEDYDEVMILAPQAGKSVVKKITGAGRNHSGFLLLTRREVLDEILLKEPIGVTYCALEDLCSTYVHAKIYLFRRGRHFELLCGSMNPTYFALFRNMELMVGLTDPEGVQSVSGFLQSFLGVGEATLDRLAVSDTVRCKRMLEESDPSVPTLEYISDMDVRRAYLRHVLDGSRSYSREEREQVASYLVSDELTSRITDIRNCIYTPIVPDLITVEKRGGKKRDVFVYPIRDRCLLGLIGFGIRRYDARLSGCLYSHRLGTSMEDSLVRIHETRPESRRVYLKTDIHRYDPSMDGEILADRIDSFFSGDPGMADCLRWVISCRKYMRDGVLHDDGPAVMSGNPLAAFFDNLYLSDLDFYMERHAGLYIRYSDDILMAAGSREEAEALYSDLLKHLSGLKLTVSEDKSLISEAGVSIDYLSWKVREEGIDVGSAILTAWNRRLREEIGEYARGLREKGYPNEMTVYSCIRRLHMIEKAVNIRSLFRYITVTDGLKRMDRMAVNIIRRSVTGHSGNLKFSLRYRHLRNMGYRSLVSQYYGYLENRQMKRM